MIATLILVTVRTSLGTIAIEDRQEIKCVIKKYFNSTKKKWAWFK